MSDLFLNRRIFTDKSTVGKLIMEELEIFILEDRARNVKIYGETCIPAGTYQLEIRQSGRYGRPMPYLLNVPFYEGIMIHWGNFPKDTNGCLLTGTTHPTVDMVGESKKAFDLLYPKIEKSLEKGVTKIHISGGFNAEEFKNAMEVRKGV